MGFILNIVHCVHRQHDEHITLNLFRWPVNPQLEFPTALNHLTQDLIDDVLELTCPLSNIPP